MRIPPALRTIRVRLALTYSALLFGISALAIGAVLLALSATLPNEPLSPVTLKKFTRLSDGTLVYKPGEQVQVADIESVQRAVNFQALTAMRDYSIAALAVMFVLSLVIGWWVARRALRPVARITATAKEIGATDLSRRVGASGPPDELHELADTMDGMLDRLDGAFRAERMLVEDVSHELRNPVAVIQANVEAVLATEDASPAERREAAAVVLGATERMRRLLEDLLASARIRSAAFEEREADLSAIAAAAVEEHRVLAGQRDLPLDERLPGGPLVFADPVALSRAVGNLLSNAVRLAPAGSTVVIAAGSRGGWAWTAVRDEGPGIPPDERDRVFERFHRVPGGDRGGSGLGLAIARQIVESHEGRLALVPAGAGSTFVLWLPDRATVAPDRRGAPPAADPLA
ncbi:sensor histidine kinase [Amnibacterium endophyticum]|uniref:histidine kinase n=1 Tax=Amnibacterium endophyticum TaxID=2109337 RepID=A0ABW4LF30_9MICO